MEAISSWPAAFAVGAIALSAAWVATTFIKRVL